MELRHRNGFVWRGGGGEGNSWVQTERSKLQRPWICDPFACAAKFERANVITDVFTAMPVLYRNAVHVKFVCNTV